jgi:hypothetical protein
MKYNKCTWSLKIRRFALNTLRQQKAPIPVQGILGGRLFALFRRDSVLAR